MYKHKRFECICESFHHSIRISHSEEYKDTYLEVKLSPFPEITLTTHKAWNSFINWVLGIKNAVLGLGNWYVVDIMLDKQKCKEIGEYLIQISEDL